MKKSHLKTLFKFLLVSFLLYFLGQRGFLSFEKTKQAFLQTHLILPAFFVLFLSTFLGIIRWQILLKAQDIHLPLKRTIELGFVGLFFNIALPGVVSGDVIKAIYVAKDVPGKRAHAFSSIIFDRVAGISALALVASFAFFASLSSPWGKIISLQIFIGALAAGIIGFYLYLFLVKENSDPLLKLLTSLEKKWKWMGSFTRTYEGIRNYHKERGAVFQTLLISTFIHLFVIFACVQFTRAFGETQIDPLALFVVCPLGLVITAIPVMPAGVGTGHAAFLFLFALLGSERGADVFTMIVLYQLIQGIVGGIVYLKFKANSPIDLNTQNLDASSA